MTEFLNIEQLLTNIPTQSDDANVESEALANMAKTEGWKIVMRKALAIKLQLLTPPDVASVESSTDLTTLGANAFACGQALKVLDMLVGEVERARIAQEREEALKNMQGESEAAA